MSTELTVAQILHLAADKYLSTTGGEHRSLSDWKSPNVKKRNYSCEAIIKAEGLWGSIGWDNACRKSRAIKFTRSLGMKPSALKLFDKFKFGRERQAVRYAWLKHAAQIAEEQGL